ncbi:hypothetical protein EVG20_g4780, partial [Dentipellis fragilis]
AASRPSSRTTLHPLRRPAATSRSRRRPPGSVATSVDSIDFSQTQNAVWDSASFTEAYPQEQMCQTEMLAGNVYQPEVERYQPQYQYPTPSTPAVSEPAQPQPQLQPEVAYGTDVSINFLQDGFCDPYPQYFDFKGLEQQQVAQYAPVETQAQAQGQLYASEMPSNANANYWTEPQQPQVGYQQYQAYEAPVQNEPSLFYGNGVDSPQASVQTQSTYVLEVPAQSPSLSPDNFEDAYFDFDFDAPTNGEVLAAPAPAQESDFFSQILFGNNSNNNGSNNGNYSGRF